MDRPIYGVYFICCTGHYLDVVGEQLRSMVVSGLLLRTKLLICFVCMYDKNKCRDLDILLQRYKSMNYPIRVIATAENLYEKFAIENYKSYIPSTHYYMYYCHTKGVSHSKKDCHFKVFEGRRRNLNFFILEKHHICLEFLQKGFDAVGTALSKYPTKHFSGNFWWARSEHLAALPLTIRNTYLAPEMYICSDPQGRYVSICQRTNSASLDHRYFTDDIIRNQSTSICLNNTESIHTKY